MPPANRLQWLLSSRSPANSWLFAPISVVVALTLFPPLLLAQGGTGALRIRVQDPQGLPVRCQVEITSDSAQVHDSAPTDSNGQLVRHSLPFGIYAVTVTHARFARFSARVQIASSVPVDIAVRLAIEPAQTKIVVSDSTTLVNPQETGTVAIVGTNVLQQQAACILVAPSTRSSTSSTGSL
jgi:hypothetical protein